MSYINNGTQTEMDEGNAMLHLLSERGILNLRSVKYLLNSHSLQIKNTEDILTLEYLNTKKITLDQIKEKFSNDDEIIFVSEERPVLSDEIKTVLDEATMNSLLAHSFQNKLLLKCDMQLSVDIDTNKKQKAEASKCSKKPPNQTVLTSPTSATVTSRSLTENEIPQVSQNTVQLQPHCSTVQTHRGPISMAPNEHSFQQMSQQCDLQMPQGFQRPNTNIWWQNIDNTYGISSRPGNGGVQQISNYTYAPTTKNLQAPTMVNMPNQNWQPAMANPIGVNWSTSTAGNPNNHHNLGTAIHNTVDQYWPGPSMNNPNGYVTNRAQYSPAISHRPAITQTSPQCGNTKAKRARRSRRSDRI